MAAGLMKRLDAARSENEATAYIRTRIRGAMVDAIRRAKTNARHAPEREILHAGGEPNDDFVGASLDTPDSTLAVKQAFEAISRLPAQMRQLFHLCLAGSSGPHIAKHLGVSESRVCRLRGELAQTLTRYLGER